MNIYHYHELVQRFAVALYILGSRYTHEFVRLNFICVLPCPTTINNLTSKSNLKLKAAIFRFDLLQEHFTLKNVKYCFASEDSTAIIKKIDYDIDTDSFVGFSTLLHNGISIAGFFLMESFQQLQQWFNKIEKASLLNLQMIQPISKQTANSSPLLLLVAYGLDNKFTFFDVVRKWTYILDDWFARYIRIIGFTTGNVMQVIFSDAIM